MQKYSELDTILLLKNCVLALITICIYFRPWKRRILCTSCSRPPPASWLLSVTLLFLDCLELSCLYSVLPTHSRCCSALVPRLNESRAHCPPFLSGWVFNCDSCLVRWMSSSAILQERLCYQSPWIPACLPVSFIVTAESGRGANSWVTLSPLECCRISLFSRVECHCGQRGILWFVFSAWGRRNSPLEFQYHHGAYISIASSAYFPWDMVCPFYLETEAFFTPRAFSVFSCFSFLAQSTHLCPSVSLPLLFQFVLSCL